MVDFTPAFLAVCRAFEAAVKNLRDPRYQTYYRVCENVVDGVLDQDTAVSDITALID